MTMGCLPARLAQPNPHSLAETFWPGGSERRLPVRRCQASEAARTPRLIFAVVEVSPDQVHVCLPVEVVCAPVADVTTVPRFRTP